MFGKRKGEVVFYHCRNCGVDAFVPAYYFDDYERYCRGEKIITTGYCTGLYGQSPPVFTVVDFSRRNLYPSAATCDMSSWATLLMTAERYGKTVRVIARTRKFYVPFSNGKEFSKDAEVRKAEMKFHHPVSRLLHFLGLLDSDHTGVGVDYDPNNKESQHPLPAPTL